MLPDSTEKKLLILSLYSPFVNISIALPAFAHAEHIAFLVDLDIGKANVPEHFLVRLGARFFLERRRWNFGKHDAVFNDPAVFLVQHRGRSLECGTGKDALNIRRVRTGLGEGC